MPRRNQRGEEVRVFLWMGALGLLTALLACPMTLAAEQGITHLPGAGVECEAPASGISFEVGTPEPVEVASEAVPCRLQRCNVTDPCTGEVFTDSTCCPLGTAGVCLTRFTRGGCILSVEAICLPSV